MSWRRIILLGWLGALLAAPLAPAWAGAAVADLAISKVPSPDPVRAGENVTYTITVDNNGPDPAANVSWSNLMPIGTSFVSLSSPPGWTPSTPAVGGSGTVSATHPALAVGTVVFTLTLKTNPDLAHGTILLDSATISTTSTDPNNGNDTGSAMVNIVAAADLSTVCTHAPDPAVAGGIITYTITVHNAGPSSATGISFTNVLPPGTTFHSFTPPLGWTPNTPAPGATGTITATRSGLPPGDDVFELQVRVDPGVADGTIITNTATAAAAVSDPNPGDESGSTAVTVRIGPRLTGAMTVAGVYAVGQTVVYSVVLANSGSLPQRDNPGDEFTCVLPAGVKLLAASASSGTAAANTGTNTVSYNGAIAAAGTVTITINARINGGTGGTTIAAFGSLFVDSEYTGVNDATVLTDDPTLPGAADNTMFEVIENPLPLSLLSAPVATPATANVGQALAFSVAVSGTAPLTYRWTINGAILTEAAPVVVFTTPGTYTAEVTVTDPFAATVAGSVLVTVVALIGGGVDSDGDGFSDPVEIAAGTDPQNAADSPSGGAAPERAVLVISKLSIKLNFSKQNADALAFAGTLPVGAGFKPAHQLVVLTAGEVIQTFRLNDKGKAAGFKLGIKSKKGVVAAQVSKYAVALKAGSFAAKLAASGFSNADTSTTLEVPVSLIFAGTIHAVTQPVSYRAKQGKSGTGKRL